MDNRIEGVLRGRLQTHQDVVSALDDLYRLRDTLKRTTEDLRMLRDAWSAHMATCPANAELPFHPGPSQADLEAWRDAPSGTASA